MKILITGIAGFIGSHLAERLLALGYQTFGVDNFSEYYDVKLKTTNAKRLTGMGATIVTMDLRDNNAYKYLPTDFDYIIHCAAQPGISHTSTAEDYISNNTIATKNILDFALCCHRLTLFINISSSSVYGIEATCTESTVPKPISYYGITKLAAEQLVLQKQQEGKLPACSLRLYSVIGPRERPEKLFSKLIDLALKDEVFPLYEGSEKHLRSFTYIGDIVDGIVSVIRKASVVNGEIINLGTEAQYTTQQGIDAVSKVLKKTIQLKIVPKRPGDQLRTKANIDKAKRLLNYSAQTSLTDSVKAQVAWFITTYNLK